ncbi:MAG: T9SS type A sorting domain-containing protein [Ignavibacteriota bacterium]
MKYLKNIAFAFLVGAIFAASAFADGKQGGPGNGDPGKGDPGKGMHYGLSDSCWSVFLSQLSPADAAKIAGDQQTIADDQKQIDALNQQIGDLLKNGKGKRDSATYAAIMALQNQIAPLQKAIGASQMEMDSIIKANGKAFETVALNCGRPDKGNRDTTKGDPGKGKPNPPDKGSRAHFGLSDSCWAIFLTQISPADAAQLAADQKIIADNQTQINDLIAKIRALKANAKDSATRVEIKSLIDQINALVKASMAAQKDFATIIRANDLILQSIRKDCGRTAIHKGNPGDPGHNLEASEIVPNPVLPGTMPSVTIALMADAEVSISIGSAISSGAPVKQIFSGKLLAGKTTETLDITGYSAGIYIVYITSGTEQIVKKLVIQ